MNKIFTGLMASAVLVLASAADALAGQPLGVQLSAPLPFVEGGLLAVAAAGVVGGAWLKRRKDK